MAQIKCHSWKEKRLSADLDNFSVCELILFVQFVENFVSTKNLGEPVYFNPNKHKLLFLG